MLALLLRIAASAAALTGATAAQPQSHASNSLLQGPEAAAIHVPAGFRATVWARGLDHPTAMAFGPDGQLYVTEDVGDIVIAKPGSTAPKLFHGGLRTPLGLAWKDRTLFVAEQGRMEAFGLRSGRRLVVGNLPFGRHQQDAVVAARDGRLYFGSGSTCDACVEKNPRSATILSVLPNGKSLRIVAHGLRNPYGLVADPRTGKLYASVNGQDELGDNEPAETVVAVRQGANYGWPRCWGSWVSRTLKGSCAGVTAPIAYLQPHSSADGITYWNGSLYVAEWGEYLSHAHGRRVVRFTLSPQGKAGPVTTFLTGLPHPLALTVAPDRSLLVADWQDGTITQITRR
jgi:glucose/arabinose dehydrogenase